MKTLKSIFAQKNFQINQQHNLPTLGSKEKINHLCKKYVSQLKNYIT
jgi:hypothetical protein